MNRTLPALALLFSGCSTGSRFAEIAPPRISAEALERHLAYLADDSLEGRDAGTEGGRKAEEYLIREFGRCGLDKVDTQPVEFIAGAKLGTGSLLEIGGRPVPAGESRTNPRPHAAP